jgi:hypothetical protein
MKEQFVTYEIALKLKELGFDEECLGYYHINQNYSNGYSFTMGDDTRTSDCTVKAPLWQQTLRWFREKHDLHINVITRYHELYNKRYWQFTIFRISQPNNNRVEESDFMYDTFDKNIKQSILKAIELVKNNNLK